MADQPIAPEDQTAWYRRYWEHELVRLAVLGGIVFFAVLACELYVLVTLPLRALAH